MHQIMEGMRPGRGDPRTRSFRVQKEVDMWQSQLPLLVDAFLQFKDRGVEEIEGQWHAVQASRRETETSANPRSHPDLHDHGYTHHSSMARTCPSDLIFWKGQHLYIEKHMTEPEFYEMAG
ncbi:hypothetical protein B0H14DRAFT_3444848 [Mycena olivaceomarginata]|nr:hypothetical protein B0H14DRAFT_3444848 [Mycena olivaceomarginata]